MPASIANTMNCVRLYCSGRNNDDYDDDGDDDDDEDDDNSHGDDVNANSKSSSIV